MAAILLCSTLLRKPVGASAFSRNISNSLRQSSPKVLSKDDSKSLEECLTEFKRDGVTILPFKMSRDFVEKSREMIMEAWKDGLARAKTIKGHDLKVGSSCKEISHRAEGRYDILWKVNGEAHYTEEENVINKILPFVYQLLGGKDLTRLAYNGCMLALPGAVEQAWHSDCQHLFTSEPDFQITGEKSSFFENNGNATTSILPCHYLNVFIPLVDVNADNGGTEFCLGSHFFNKFTPEDIIYQNSAHKERIGYMDDGVHIKVEAGDILVFDFRLLHRALPHNGNSPRPMLYYSYCKQWFRDNLSWERDLPSLHEAIDTKPS